jgi:membrane fusion protein, multidrug efflux system
VRGDFPNPDRALKPGMLMRITLSRSERPALLVPEIAVVQVGEDAFVFRVGDDDTVERVAVRVGARRQGQAEMLAGVSAGDRIVVDGTGKLRPGMAITEGPAGGPQARPEGDAAPSQGG